MTDLPRVAIVHDYLTQRGGAERVVMAMTRVFPSARLYTTMYEPSTTYPEFAASAFVVAFAVFPIAAALFRGMEYP